MVTSNGRSNWAPLYLFYRGANPVHESEVSERPHLLILPLGGSGFQHINLGGLGGHTYSDHSSLLLDDYLCFHYEVSISKFDWKGGKYILPIISVFVVVFVCNYINARTQLYRNVCGIGIIPGILRMFNIYCWVEEHA